MDWQIVLADSVQDGKIRELHLRKIPRLKNCYDWNEVEPVGWIDHQMKHAHFKGGLVKLNGKIYFVTDSTINAISEFVKIKFPNKIVVVSD
jgi:hypothetical protein